jgi:hypothetical protein
MATWKKIIASGSAAHLSNVTASNLTDTNLVIAGVGGALQNSTLTLTGGTLALGSNSITSTGASSVLSGSFSGSFSGNGSGLTGVIATAIFPTTLLTPLLDTTQFYVNDGSNKYVTTNQIYTASFAKVSGDITITDGGVATISTNAVALGTDTTGNYVATITAGSGIASTGANTGEDIAHTISLKNASGLTNNTLVKWDSTNTQLSNSTITDDGTTVTIGGNLQVNGTTTVINTTNLTVTDQFILLGSGSVSNKDGGIIIQSAAIAGSGFAFAYDDTTDRWYMQDALSSTATGLGTVTDTATTMAVVGAQRGTAASRPADGTGPIYGGTSGYGHMWIDSDANNDIWIYV